MPNHIINLIKIEGNKEDCISVLEFLEGKNKDENGYKTPIDFNNIIKMPASLDIEDGSITPQAIALYLYEKENDDSKLQEMLKYPWAKEGNYTIETLIAHLKKQGATAELGEIYTTNMKLYGCYTWYDWCKKHWGTKWNAYSCERISGEDVYAISFNTAWNNVANLISIVSSKFPNVEIHYGFSDEDKGYNLGTMVFKAGEVIKQYFPKNGSEEAYELADNLWEININNI